MMHDYIIYSSQRNYRSKYTADPELPSINTRDGHSRYMGRPRSAAGTSGGGYAACLARCRAHIMRLYTLFNVITVVTFGETKTTIDKHAGWTL